MSARQDLVRLLAEDPGAIVEDVAKAQNATARDVVEALPAQMRKFAPGSAFIDASAPCSSSRERQVQKRR